MNSANPSLAVVGCGYWGSKHVRVCYENPSVDMALAVDSRRERLDYIRSEYPGVATAQSFDSVLASDAIDGVIIATPISTHFDLAREALRAGKHVLVEKPLATSAAECDELIRIAERNNRVLMVGHTFEYHPAVAFMRDYISSGKLGDLYYISSARLNLGLYQPDANVLWDLAPHDLSIIFSVIDRPMDSMCVWGCDHILPGVEDVVYAKMTFSGGAFAHVHVSWLDPVKVRRVTVVGSEGMLVFDDVTPTEKVRVYDKRFKPEQQGDRFVDFQSAYHHGDVTIPAISNAEPLRQECDDFVSAIVNGTRPIADGYSGRRVVEALEAATHSLMDGGLTHHRKSGADEAGTVIPFAPRVAPRENRQREGEYAAGD